MKSSPSLEGLIQAIAVFDERKVKNQSSITSEEWKEYHSLKRQLDQLTANRKRFVYNGRVSLRAIRKYNEGIVYRGERL